MYYVCINNYIPNYVPSTAKQMVPQKLFTCPFSWNLLELCVVNFHSIHASNYSTLGIKWQLRIFSSILNMKIHTIFVDWLVHITCVCHGYRSIQTPGQLRLLNSDPPNSDPPTQTPQLRPSQVRPLPIQTSQNSVPSRFRPPNSDPSRFRPPILTFLG